MLAPLLLLVAAAPPVADAAFVANCRTHATPAVCQCVAGRLQSSNDGRLMLELETAYAAAPKLSQAEIVARLDVIRSRYAVVPGVSLGPRLDAAMGPAAAACEPKGTS
jgi:hypothetical protein